jgi:outer membrane protein TolC
LKGRLQLRQAQQREAAIYLQRTVLNAWQEVDNAMADFSLAQKQRDQLSEAVKQNSLAVEIAQKQYSEGSADFLNVLTMQNSLLSSQRLLVQATAKVSLSVTTLYRSIGGGWETKFPESAGEAHERAASGNPPKKMAF